MLAIIGGTGIYELAGMQVQQHLDEATPFGRPSGAIVKGRLGGRELLFLARHGSGHKLLPHEVNYRANIYALKRAGATQILGFSAVGSLVQEIAPGDLAMPSQYFDWTRGGRARSFFGEGVAVYASLIDTRPKTPRIYASSCNAFFGMKILRSTDLGKKFKETKSVPAFSKEDGRALANIWSIEKGSGRNDLWCGVEPAALFRSGDGGDSWEMVDGLSNHPHARKWNPGNGGLCLHTILLDPVQKDRIFIAISAAGAFRTDDGGASWLPINKGLRSGEIPDEDSETGHCVHDIVQHPARPETLYMQKHWDVMRSDDAGGRWHEVSGNLPTDFGFTIAVHPHEPETIYVVPITSDSLHYPPEGKLRVYRSRTGGDEWEPLSKGLPQKDCYVNIYRDAMAVDTLDEAGIYFGTTGGQVYRSADAGETWAPIVRDLPAVLSVETQVLA